MANQTLVGNTTFNGLTFLATRTINLASSAGFVVAGSFICLGSATTQIVLSATTAGQRGILRIGSGQNVAWTIATDIDSSLGVLVTDSAGTITNTINWSTGGTIVVGGRKIVFFEFFEG